MFCCPFIAERAWGGCWGKRTFQYKSNADEIRRIILTID